MNNRLNDIVSKSCKLFQKFGIKSVSMDDIARECGISKKTLYEAVKDKRKLVEKIIDFEFNKESHAPHTVDFKDFNAVDVLFLVYQSAIDFFKDFNLSMEYDLRKYYPDLYERNIKRRREHIYQKMVINMEQGRKEGSFKNDFNIDIIARLHILKIEGLLQSDIFDDTDYSIVEIFKELFTHHFMAIATEQGKQAFDKKLAEIN